MPGATEHAGSITLDVATTLAALDNAIAFNKASGKSKETSKAAFIIDGERIHLHAAHDDDAIWETLENATHTGSVVNIAFNPLFLRDALKSTSAATVQVYQYPGSTYSSREYRPLTVEASDLRAVIMPMSWETTHFYTTKATVWPLHPDTPQHIVDAHPIQLQIAEKQAEIAQSIKHTDDYTTDARNYEIGAQNTNRTELERGASAQYAADSHRYAAQQMQITARKQEELEALQAQLAALLPPAPAPGPEPLYSPGITENSNDVPDTATEVVAKIDAAQHEPKQLALPDEMLPVSAVKPQIEREPHEMTREEYEAIHGTTAVGTHCQHSMLKLDAALAGKYVTPEAWGDGWAGFAVTGIPDTYHPDTKA